jgi:hypothetical protein
MQSSLLCFLLPIAFVLSGCAAESPTENRTEAERRLQIVAQMFNRYAASHQGNVPPNEKALKDFINKLATDEKQGLKIENVDDFLKSPNDNKPFVIKYGIRQTTTGTGGKGPVGNSGGADKAGPPKPAVFAGESSGAKRYVVYANGKTELIDEAEALQRLK